MSREERRREREKERKRERAQEARGGEEELGEMRCGTRDAVCRAALSARPCRAVLPRARLPRLASPRLTSPHLASPRLTSPRLASSRRGAARLGSARCATPRCCRLTYLSAVAPPATGYAASVQTRCFAHLYPRFHRPADPTTAQFTRSRSLSRRPYLLPPPYLPRGPPGLSSALAPSLFAAAITATRSR